MTDNIQVLGTPSPFFRLLDIQAEQVDAHGTAIADLRAGALTGIIVRSIYENSLLENAVRRLELHDPPFLKTWFPEKFRSWFYGLNLNLMQTDPESYFKEAESFHQQLKELLPDPLSFDNHVMKILSRLDSRRPYRAAPGPDPGQSYMVTTFRGHGEGGYIPAHCDNEQTLRPAYEHLQTIVSSHMYSMVLLLGKPRGGGCLEIFDYRVEPEDAKLMNDDGFRQKPSLSELSSATVSLNAGDLIVVDSGRWLHRVTPVIGETVRWTACSFMAHATDRNAVYCWG